MTISISRYKTAFSIFGLLLISFWSNGQNSDFYINEFMASNKRGILDEFSEYSDWIELYNGGTTAINLEGYSITDDKGDISKWIFPAYSFQPGKYLTVFASGRDIKTLPVIWSTVIDAGAMWRYIIPNSNITGWNTSGFSDVGWSLGKSGFGYGDDDDSTVVPARTVCVYVRKEFTVDDPGNVKKAFLHIDYDDSFIAYLNGKEVARANIGTSGTPVSFNLNAYSDKEANMYWGRLPEKFEMPNIGSYFRAGTNVLAIEVHNVSPNSSDLTLIPFLSLGFSSFNGTPYANTKLGLPESAFHTNFKLSAEGEFIGFYDTAGNVVDTISFLEQIDDVSYGRSANDPDIWGFLRIATPGRENVSGFMEVAAKPLFSIPGGFYTDSQNLVLSTSSATAKIYYTTDGIPPDTNSFRYTVPITLDSTIAIRAVSAEAGKISSDMVTQTYFINEEIHMPFISLVTDPDHFFSDQTGIYVTGTNGTAGSCDKKIRNVNQDWERPVNIEFYEPTGELAFNQVAGIKIFGGCSRTRFPQKSLALYARSSYGTGSFKYQLFPDKQINEFEAFVLRSAADDQQRTFMRDGLTQEVLIEYMDMEYQAYRPAVVFINGEYWGIHNIREKLNEHYFTENFGIEPENLNILEGNAWVTFGSNASYNSLINFVNSNNMASDNSYSYVKTKMDVEQFIEYEIANIYLGEIDWPGNNIKFWNTNTGDYTRWRWINFDKDQCFMHYRLPMNTLDLATYPSGTGWPNPAWSTLLLRSLLTNEKFRNNFIQIYAYHLSTTFKPERLIHHIDSFQAILAPEIPRHTERWGDQRDPDSQETWQFPTFESLDEWNSFVDTLRIFSRERPPYAIQHLVNKFGLSSMDNLAIDVNIENSGNVKLYNRKIPGGGYNGDYFRGVPIKLKAFPEFGYSFSHWIASTASGNITYSTPEIQITLNGSVELTAFFERTSGVEGSIVIINEINYNSSSGFDPGDWLEFYNRHVEAIDMTGWYLKDSDDKNIYYFPNGFELGANSYVVICQDVAAFSNKFPQVTNRMGDLGFKLDNAGEVIRLYSSDKTLVDSVLYDDKSPWPTLADGTGPTLELKNTNLNNDLGENWTAIAQKHGTPGRENGVVESINENVLADKNVLYQNYPNPFGGYTIIPYSITERGYVRISIYDMLGNEIVTLVNQHREVGKYSAEFNAGDLPNGIFIYTMRVNDSPVKTRRMVINH